jgi:hypothetical protein
MSVSNQSKPKIKFIVPSKQIESIQLNPIINLGNFQSLNQEDEFKKTRLDKIDYHYQFYHDILASKKKSGLSSYNKYLGPAINELHKLIFEDKKLVTDKNDKIDNILKFYDTYVQRQTRNHELININVTDTDVVLKSNSNVFGITNTDTNYISDEEEEEEIDF